MLSINYLYKEKTLKFHIFLKEAVPIVSAHPKYFSETAKPPSEEEEYAGKDLPLGAAIIAVADAYDAIITYRPYRAGMQPWQALEELEKGAGRQFHPGLVKALKEVLMSKQKYRK